MWHLSFSSFPSLPSRPSPEPGRKWRPAKSWLPVDSPGPKISTPKMNGTKQKTGESPCPYEVVILSMGIILESSIWRVNKFELYQQLHCLYCFKKGGLKRKKDLFVWFWFWSNLFASNRLPRIQPWHEPPKACSASICEMSWDHSMHGSPVAHLHYLRITCLQPEGTGLLCAGKDFET